MRMMTTTLLIVGTILFNGSALAGCYSDFVAAMEISASKLLVTSTSPASTLGPAINSAIQSRTIPHLSRDPKRYAVVLSIPIATLDFHGSRELGKSTGFASSNPQQSTGITAQQLTGVTK